MLNFYNGYTRGQRYVSWKASTKLSMVPRNKAPLSNGSALTDPEGNAANVFPARRPGPMKHYRLRGSTQALANDQCTKCNGKLFITGSIKDGNTNCPCTNDGKYGYQIRSASTVLGSKNADGTRNPKTYASSHREYLQKRCKTFEQRQFNYDGTGANKANNEYLANCDCSDKPNGCTTANCRKVIYKRSNAGFSTQGAVSSGSRLHKLKHDTITSSGAKYRNSYQSIYNTKSKTNNCSVNSYPLFAISSVNGKRLRCTTGKKVLILGTFTPLASVYVGGVLKITISDANIASLGLRVGTQYRLSVGNTSTITTLTATTNAGEDFQATIGTDLSATYSGQTVKVEVGNFN